MYNGIGLQSVRGSGTNGYVTKNLSHVPHRRSARDDKPWAASRATPLAPRAPSAEILEHERRRQVEVQLAELRDELEATGALREDEIERRLDERRERLTKRAEEAAAAGGGGYGGGGALVRADARGETHRAAAAKLAEDAQVRKALGIDGGHVVGAAFDRDLQAARKAERQAQREAEAEAAAQKRTDAEHEAASRARDEARRAHKAERAARKEERRVRREARREERRAAKAAAPPPPDGGADDSRSAGKEPRGDERSGSGSDASSEREPRRARKGGRRAPSDGDSASGSESDGSRREARGRKRGGGQNADAKKKKRSH